MSSTSHPSPESIQLAGLGGALLDTIVQTTTFTLLYGGFILLLAQVTSTFLQKHRGKKGHLWMFLASVLNFLLATVHAGTYYAILGIFVHSALIENQDKSLAEKRPLVNGLLLMPNVVGSWMASFEPIISDGIVVWRAFVLLQHRRRLVFPALFLLLCSAASALVNVILSAKDTDLDTWSVKTSLTVSVGLSLATNIVATSLIGYLYCQHRSSMSIGFGGRHRPTQTERTMALLVESGILFCLLQIVYFITQLFPNLTVHDTAGHYARQMFNAGYFAFSAMYPTLVAVLINNHRTIDEIYSFGGASLPPISQYTEHNDISTLQHIAFARPKPAGNLVEYPEKVEEESSSMERR